MKKLLVVAFVAMIALSQAGCNRGWSCWLFRGATCDTCGTTVIDSNVPPPPSQLPEPVN